MKVEKHDVFISYRRDGGEHLAGRVKAALKDRGLAVFMDVEDLKSGKFDEALLRRIEEAIDVVVILTPGCLERCKNSDDWLRREIRHAIETDRNIVPVLARGFNMPDTQSLPSDIAALPAYHGLHSTHEFFTESMDKLASTLLQAKPRKPSPPLTSRVAAHASPHPLVMRGLPLHLSGWNGTYHLTTVIKNGRGVWARPEHWYKRFLPLRIIGRIFPG